MIQGNVLLLVCEQTNSWNDSLQAYITAAGGCFLWRTRAPNAFVHRKSTPNP